MTDYTLLAVLLALLFGVVIGKAWERYKLRDGRLIDRRRLRDTPHYMLGLNSLVENHAEQAIDELTQATSSDSGALEIQMILGNLYRQKGQVGRAINIHQALLQRPDLTPLEHAYVLLCLGLDYRHGGFVDRAFEAFQEVVVLDPSNRYALVNLQRLHEDQHRWAEAAAVRERVVALDGSSAPAEQHILGFLRYQIGLSEAAAGNDRAAVAGFKAAIDADSRTTPAYLSLGDALERSGDLAQAIGTWETLVRTVPDRAHLALERLERVYEAAGTPMRFVELCERLIQANPREWRARLALSRHASRVGRHADAFELLLGALPRNPHGLAIHQEIWHVLLALDLDPERVQRYVQLTTTAVFYLDPHICVRCRYRSTELLWQCPQCHEWATFVEERLAPARDAAEGA
jgi:lipopolysaccharide biosynthesis regulator YciM